MYRHDDSAGSDAAGGGAAEGQLGGRGGDGGGDAGRGGVQHRHHHGHHGHANNATAASTATALSNDTGAVEVSVIPMRHRKPPIASNNDSSDKQALASIAAAASDMKGGKTKEEVTKLSAEVRQNLADQAWNSVEKQADSKLQEALAETNKIIEDALESAQVLGQEQRKSLVDALVTNIKFSFSEAQDTDEGNDIIREVDEFGYSIRVPPRKIQTRGGDSLSGATIDPDLESSTYTGGNDNNSDDDDSLCSLDDRSHMSDHTTHSKTIRLTQEIIPPAMRPNTLGSGHGHGHGYGGEAAAPPGADSTLTSGNTSPFLTRMHTISGNSAGNPLSAAAAAASVTTVDPSEGLHTLPIYLRGGASTTGFGALLGNALALLYVARQGLRESELWKILSLLQSKSEQEQRVNHEVRAQNHGIVRRVAAAFLKDRGPITEKFKSDDINHTGYITRKQMLISVRKHNSDLSLSDLIKMLEFVSAHAPPAVQASHANQSNTMMHYYQDRELIVGHHVHYQKLYMLLTKQNKQFKFTEKPKRGKDSLLATTTNLNGASSTAPAAPRTPKAGLRSAAAAGVGGTAGSAGGAGVKTATEQGLLAGAANEDDFDNFQLSAPFVDPQQVAIKRWHAQSSDPDAGKLRKSGAAASQDDFADGDFGFGRSGKTQMTAATTGSSRRGADDGADAAAADDDDDEDFSLGAVIEESLISILSALGVLHDPENKVLILPSDSEPFRQVIYNNYILKRNGGSLLSWHQLLVQHFQTEPNSLRKCEELPWHLKICRKWHTLRDTLVDLRTFDLMARHDLRDELFEYWVLLTEGPLLLPEPASSAAPGTGLSSANNTGSSFNLDGQHGQHGQHGRPVSPTGRGNSGAAAAGTGVGGITKRRGEDDSLLGNESTYTHVLREIDEAAERGMTVKEARKRNLKNQVLKGVVYMILLFRFIDILSYTIFPSPSFLFGMNLHLFCSISFYSVCTTDSHVRYRGGAKQVSRDVGNC